MRLYKTYCYAFFLVKFMKNLVFKFQTMGIKTKSYIKCENMCINQKY